MSQQWNRVDFSPHDDGVLNGKVRERNLVDSLDELVRVSDAVVVASVLEVKPGRQAGDAADGPGGLLQFFDVSLAIDQTIRGKATGSITIEILPIASPDGFRGFPAFDPEQAWWQPGGHPLHRSQPDALHRGYPRA